MSDFFIASFPGKCAVGDRILAGDTVRYVDGELTHDECANPKNLTVIDDGKLHKFEGTSLDDMGF